MHDSGPVEAGAGDGEVDSALFQLRTQDAHSFLILSSFKAVCMGKHMGWVGVKTIFPLSVELHEAIFQYVTYFSGLGFYHCQQGQRGQRIGCDIAVAPPLDHPQCHPVAVLTKGEETLALSSWSVCVLPLLTWH